MDVSSFGPSLLILKREGKLTLDEARPLGKRDQLDDAPFARLLLTWAVQLYQIRPRFIRLDAAYWGLKLIAWIHATLGAVAVIPWNPKTPEVAF